MYELKSLSVVIPNYNGQKLLAQNLPILLDAIHASVKHYEIIIADDASSDDSVTWIEQHYPQIILVKNPVNGGFSKAMNAGIKAASNELILAVNTDIEVTPGFIEPMFRYFEMEDTFGVSCRLQGYDHQLQDAGKWPSYGYTGLRSTTDFKVNNFEALYPLQTWFCSAACCLYDAKKVKLLGGYDEVFSPFYYEDADICLRAWCMGWPSYFENKAVCKHPNSVTIKQHNKSDYIRMISNRNKLIINFRFLKGLRLLTYTLLLIAKLCTSWAGKRWFYASVLLYMKQRKAIAMANKRFADLKPVQNLAQVRQLILQQLKNEEVELF